MVKEEKKSHKKSHKRKSVSKSRKKSLSRKRSVSKKHKEHKDEKTDSEKARKAAKKLAKANAKFEENFNESEASSTTNNRPAGGVSMLSGPPQIAPFSGGPPPSNAAGTANFAAAFQKMTVGAPAGPPPGHHARIPSNVEPSSSSLRPAGPPPGVGGASLRPAGPPPGVNRSTQPAKPVYPDDFKPPKIEKEDLVYLSAHVPQLVEFLAQAEVTNYIANLAENPFRATTNAAAMKKIHKTFLRYKDYNLNLSHIDAKDRDQIPNLLKHYTTQCDYKFGNDATVDKMMAGVILAIINAGGSYGNFEAFTVAFPASYPLHGYFKG